MSQQSSPDIDPVTGLPWPVDIYGRPIRPDDPFLPVLRQRGQWARGARNLDLPRQLARGVGRHMPNDPSDVAAMEMWLGRAGYYDLDRREGPTGYGSPTVDDAILRFQKDHGLTADGWAGPGGETEQALRLKAGVFKTATPPTFAHVGRPSLLTDEPLLQEAGWSGAARVGMGLWRAWPHVRRWLQPDEATPPAPPPIPMPKPPVPPVGQQPDLPPVPPSTPHSEDLPQPGNTGGIADYLLDGLGTLFRNSGGARGSEKTQRKNDVVARECQSVIDNEFMDGYSGQHIGGAHQGGPEGDYLKEEIVRPGQAPTGPLAGSVRPDLTWIIKTPDGEEHVRLNTVDTTRGGMPTTREQRALDKLRQYVQKDLVDWMSKDDDDPDSPEFAERARAKCRQIFSKYVRKSP